MPVVESKVAQRLYELSSPSPENDAELLKLMLSNPVLRKGLVEAFCYSHLRAGLSREEVINNTTIDTHILNLFTQPTDSKRERLSATTAQAAVLWLSQQNIL